MKYQISGKPDGLDIKVEEVEGSEDKILDAFQQCKEGRCACPTQEYKKLDSLQIEQSAGGISLRLKSKEGAQFDRSEIERCLEYTKAQVKLK
jgi:hypothetical protein